MQNTKLTIILVIGIMLFLAVSVSVSYTLGAKAAQKTEKIVAVTEADAIADAALIKPLLTEYLQVQKQLAHVPFGEYSEVDMENTSIYLERINKLRIKTTIGKATVSFFATAILYDRMLIGTVLKADTDNIDKLLRNSMDAMEFAKVFHSRLAEGSMDFNTIGRR